MKVVNVVILENNEEFLGELKACFEADEGFAVCYAGNNGKAGIDAIEKCRPEVAIVDTVLYGTDGLGVMDYVRDHDISCNIFVISNFADDNLVNKTIARGAKYYFVKPVPAQTVCDRVKETLAEKTADYLVSEQTRDRRRVTSIDEKISNIFMVIGIPPHIKGYQYLREGIKIAIEKPLIINSITKELYPTIAAKFDTSASKVERAIRHAIEVAWNRGRIEALGSVFGTHVYVNDERPTNSEFIALIADKLLLESLR